MDIRAHLETALEALLANRIRSVLALVGMILGVATLIIMVSIGVGARESVTAQIQALGSNILGVFPGSTGQFGVRLSLGTVQTLTAQDAEAIANAVPEVQAVAPEYARPAQVVSSFGNATINISGITPGFQTVRNFFPEEGTFIGPAHLAARARVAVLGRTAVERLYGDRQASPLQSSVKINRIPFTVIGVMAEKGFDGIVDWDDVVFVPLSTAQRRLFGVQHVRAIYVKVRRAEDLTPASEQIQALLRFRHRVPAGGEPDFVVRNQAEVLAVVRGISRTLTLMLAGIATVSLWVGGLGIMNIMLASVSERRWEIGLRRAVGAKRRDILGQFLAESMMLGAVGGLLGTGAGVAASTVISRVAGWATAISFQAILIAFSFALVVGVLSGLYPATQAAAVDPAIALKYE